ncbi:phytanoyl-CoA dioxygenase family protein [Sphingomonas leidyi]|uniref:phytanoyl-CoA dioxygenase family protein n=1 Tax=Sphingomonas leidyi TaxID=68569 RepID=UPI00142061B9
MLSLNEDGAAHLAGAAAPFLGALLALAASQPVERAGIRLHRVPGLAELLGPAALGGLVAGMRPVRAILFDKSPGANWLLGWHQDRTIAVRARCEVPGFGPWSVKQGLLHVEPPFALIEAMRTMRIHLDPVPQDNAPLLIAPGSHRLGRIPESELAAVVERCGTACCLADTGDVWLYATPIVHASAASSGAGRRRVLQVDFAGEALPPGLEWLGV